MKLRRFVREGDEIPRGYGVAWSDPARWGAVCYPFPFHKPIGWLRRWYWDAVQPPRSPEADRLKRRVAELEKRLLWYREQEKRDEAWTRELVKTVRRLEPLE